MYIHRYSGVSCPAVGSCVPRWRWWSIVGWLVMVSVRYPFVPNTALCQQQQHQRKMSNVCVLAAHTLLWHTSLLSLGIITLPAAEQELVPTRTTTTTTCIRCYCCCCPFTAIHCYNTRYHCSRRWSSSTRSKWRICQKHDDETCLRTQNYAHHQQDTSYVLMMVIRTTTTTTVVDNNKATTRSL